MRLWTVHPKYLDASGLVALWREALLARAVLRGATRGYRHHPQLLRFRAQPDPVPCVNSYLAPIYTEAVSRGYRFDPAKLGRVRAHRRLAETEGQLAYEWKHLRRKLRMRSPGWERGRRFLAQLAAWPFAAVLPGALLAAERTAPLKIFWARWWRARSRSMLAVPAPAPGVSPRATWRTGAPSRQSQDLHLPGRVGG